MTRRRRFGTVRLRSGHALEWSVPKAHERERSRLHRQRCTSEDARAYIDRRARARAPAPTATTAHERDAQAYIDNGARAGTLAPISTTVRGRRLLRLQLRTGPRHTRRGPGRGVSRTPSLKSREDRHPPLTAESNSSAENLGHSPKG